MINRQPLHGRAKNGGLRLGEMERDCLLAHGSSQLLRERLLFSSDDYFAPVCDMCGLLCSKKGCNNCRNVCNHVKTKLPLVFICTYTLCNKAVIPRTNGNVHCTKNFHRCVC